MNIVLLVASTVHIRAIHVHIWAIHVHVHIWAIHVHVHIWAIHVHVHVYTHLLTPTPTPTPIPKHHPHTHTHAHTHTRTRARTTSTPPPLTPPFTQGLPQSTHTHSKKHTLFSIPAGHTASWASWCRCWRGSVWRVRDRMAVERSLLPPWAEERRPCSEIWMNSSRKCPLHQHLPLLSKNEQNGTRVAAYMFC